MHNIPKTTGLIAMVALIAIGVAGRYFPHPWNTTPLAAIALLASAYFGLRKSLVVTIAIMAISDILIGTYDFRIMAFVYASILLASAMGLFMKEKKNPRRVIVCATASSIIFFLVTNWAVWQFGTMYEHTWRGLLESYKMALPFFRNSLVGDVFYSSAFFGIFETASIYYRRKKSAAVEA